MTNDKAQNLKKMIKSAIDTPIGGTESRAFIDFTTKEIRKVKTDIKEVSDSLENTNDAVVKIYDDVRSKIEITQKKSTDHTDASVSKVKRELTNEIDSVKLDVSKLQSEERQEIDVEALKKDILSNIPEQIEQVIETGESIVDKINQLEPTEENQIDASHIKNLPKVVAQHTTGSANKYIANLLDVDLSNVEKVDGKYVIGGGSGAVAQPLFSISGTGQSGIPGTYFTSVVAGTIASGTANRIVYSPFTANFEVTLDSVSIECTVSPSGTAKFRVGVYSVDDTGALTGEPLFDSEFTFAAAGVFENSLGGVVIPVGNYVTAVTTDTPTTQMRIYKSPVYNLLASTGGSPFLNRLIGVFTYGALPTTPIQPNHAVNGGFLQDNFALFKWTI